MAQMFAFTPIAFMIMRGVVQGVSPSLEEASQTLRATRMQTFWHITLPLLKPGLANAFLVGFIESMADFGNPIILGGQFSVLSTEIFFAIVGAAIDPGMAAALSLVLTVFALAVFVLQQQVLRGRSIHHRLGQRRCRCSVELTASCLECLQRCGRSLVGLYLGGLCVCLCGWLCSNLGARLHLHLESFQDSL